MARKSEEEEEEIAPVWVPVPARAVLAVSEKRHWLSDAAESKDFRNSEGRLGVDLMVIQKKRQQQKFALEQKLKAAKALPVQKTVPSMVIKTIVMVMDVEEDAKSGLPVAWGRGSLQVTADFEVCFKATGWH